MLNSKDSIKKWLDTYDVQEYEILDNFHVNVQRKVSISSREIVELPIYFNIVEGDFDIYDNKLTSMKGFPKVVYGDLAANKNNISSSEYAPDYVGGKFFLSFNNISNVELLKTKIKKTLYCDNNPLEDLKGLTAEFKSVYFYKENNIDFRLKGLEEFYDEKGFLNLSYEMFKKIALRNQLDFDLTQGTSIKPKI